MPLSLHERWYLQLFCWCSGPGWVLQYLAHSSAGLHTSCSFGLVGGGGGAALPPPLKHGATPLIELICGERRWRMIDLPSLF